MRGTNHIAVLLAGLSFPAMAQDPAPDSIDGVQLAAAETIVVTGQRDAYGARKSRSATKTDTPIIDIPQALTIISAKQVEDQALRSVA